ncbi:unnamed protein product [Phytomonas sp. EM1]|nr:unnamed protein product [Phytomonas sp. EM1]|eukprot:CCW63369.1 unnamed protein product [Phytomonas sp. isolate EM1]
MYRCSRCLGGLYHLSDLLRSRVRDLRIELSQKKAAGASPLRVLDLENQLVIELGRSARPEERTEALRSAEEVWRRLEDPRTPLAAPSRTAMRVMLCTTMRRCALLAKHREAAEVWTARFAQRAARLQPQDFIQDGEEMRGWEKTPTPTTAKSTSPLSPSSSQLRAQFGTSLTEEDIDESAQRGDVGASPNEEGENDAHPKRRELSPMQKYRQDLVLSHPMIGIVFKGRQGPGPRYTG